MKENWKILQDAPNYSVSDLGRIKNNTTGKFLKGTINSEGYLWITLRAYNQNLPRAIHRLVGHYFVSNPMNLPEINHVKGIKTDNRASELEWTTKKANLKHAVDTGLRIQYRGGKINACKKVKNTKTGNIYSSLKEAAKQQNIPYQKFRSMMSGVIENTSFCEYC